MPTKKPIRKKNSKKNVITESGTIVRFHGKLSLVELDNAERISCESRVRQKGLMAGDQVEVLRDDISAVIVSRGARRNEIKRWDDQGREKIVAANVDQLMVVIAPKPDPFTHLIDRYLAAAKLNHIAVTLVLNKIDMLTAESDQQAFSKLLDLYQNIGYPVVSISAKTGEGLPNLLQQLRGKQSIFVGQSGVGKSSLVNCLFDNHDIKTNALSDGTNKGKHTTTHTELFQLDADTKVLDSPGIREFGLGKVDKDLIRQGFIEIYNEAEYCRFRDCNHINAPNCAVKDAVENGSIAHSRYQSYLYLMQE